MGQSESVVVPPLGNDLLGFPDDSIARNMISTMAEMGKYQQIHHTPISIVCQRRQRSIFKELKTEVARLTGNTIICILKNLRFIAYRLWIGHLYKDLYKGDLKTPAYWTQYDQTKIFRKWNCHSISARCWNQVKEREEERFPIKIIVKDSWVKQFVGHGHDSWVLKALNNTSIHVERIEKSLLAERYFECRSSMFHKVGKLDSTFAKLKDISCETSGAILITEKTDKTLTRKMCHVVNEHYLSNGTTVGCIDVKSAKGFDNRRTENNNQFSTFRGDVRKTWSSPKPASTAKRENSDSFIDIGNTSVSIINGNLEEQEADIIMNSVAPDLDLTKGAGSNAISEFGAPEIQKECDDRYSDGISFGDAAITSGGQLKCCKVYHVALPKWNESEQELQKIMKKCFNYIGKYNEKIKSVVIPPLGHGIWGFPDDVIAKNLISTLVELAEDSQIHHLSVNIVCHRREHSVFKVS
ncbi:unnamed protein product [Mytilus coruscus]|uniref:Macro domain-containing protein n=1 Tax=Mytilus coruscus TaxID=42192 RepID=A0A6J8A999_MYTCO|nr:unnamed protein product [Mytilus coruscus]